MERKRGMFSGKIGFVLAAAGSAVGLGNIWRFPYETGQNGGAAFILIYIICVLVLAMPVMIAEFVIGRGSRTNASHAFKKLAPGSWWKIIGYICISAPVIIVGFYFVISGWTLEYVIQSLTPGGMVTQSAEAYADEFNQFISSPLKPLVWVILFILINHFILMRGVNSGIEKAANILMPLLFLILIIFCIRSIFLPGFSEGMRFLFMPDFSKITPNVVLRAMGQAFFSMSVGMGILITYASYYSKETRLARVAGTVATFDTLVAILAGIIIFPTVFTFGISPSQGPELIFITLPNLFAQMQLGWLWSSLFFVLVSLAALTSTISLLEVITAFMNEEWKLSRRKAAIIASCIIAVLGVLASLSLGLLKDYTIAGMNFFDLLDNFTAKFLMPIGGLAIAVFCGWVLDKKRMEAELSNNGQLKLKYIKVFAFLLKYITPLAILAIFIDQLM